VEEVTGGDVLPVSHTAQAASEEAVQLYNENLTQRRAMLTALVARMDQRGAALRDLKAKRNGAKR
jgi:hypothetical protein